MRPPRGRGLFVGRYFDIEFYLDYSWFLIAALMVYSLNKEFLSVSGLKDRDPWEYWLMASTGALAFFFCILLHELGHSLVSQRCGIPVPRITLMFMGGLAEISREPDNARTELKIAVGGPIVSLGLSALLFGSTFLLSLAQMPASSLVCQFLAVANLMLVIFNLVPGYPLDGGRILRAILWARTGKLRWATYITSRIGIAFSWILVVLGLYLLVVLQAWNGVIFLLISIFLRSAAEAGYQHAIQKEVLGGVSVRDVMTPTPICIPADRPLNLAVDEYFLTNHHVAFPVVDEDGLFRGMVRLEFLRDVPREKWPYLSVGDLASERQTSQMRVEPGTTAARAMRLLLTAETGRLAVTEQEKVIGIITRHDILHFIKIHTELEE